MKSLKMLMMAALTILSVSVFAQDSTKQKMKTHKQHSEKIQYSCPMHPDVTSDKPGKCNKCGMDLTKTKKEQMKMEVMKMYSCPMHPDVTSDKAGKCSKCGMDLKKMDMTYTCPNHPEVNSNRPGKCPKCGTLLNLTPKEKMKMEVMKMYACPMHADVTSAKPGKCPKCGMDLIKNEKDTHQH